MNKNGRVIIDTPDLNTLFNMKEKVSVSVPASDYRDAMKGNWYNTVLSDAFFSKENIQILQNGIRRGVYEASNKQYIIGNQSETELKTVMRSIFLQHSKNQKKNIKQQIVELNNLVLEYSIKQAYGEAKSYIKYTKDASSMYEPIPHPVMSTSNDKQLVFNGWF